MKKKKEKDLRGHVQFSREAHRMKRRLLHLQDDERDQQMDLLVTKAFHPYVEYGKASLLKLVSHEIYTGRDKLAPETRTCIKQEVLRPNRSKEIRCEGGRSHGEHFKPKMARR